MLTWFIRLLMRAARIARLCFLGLLGDCRNKKGLIWYEIVRYKELNRYAG